MSGDEPVASRVVRYVLTRAMGDAAYRRTLLNNPNEVMRFELARAGGPVPDITIRCCRGDRNEPGWCECRLGSPSGKSSRSLEPLFKFVDSADPG